MFAVIAATEQVKNAKLVGYYLGLISGATIIGFFALLDHYGRCPQ